MRKTSHDPSVCNTDINTWEPNPFGKTTLCSQKLVKLVPQVHKHSQDEARELSTERQHSEWGYGWGTGKLSLEEIKLKGSRNEHLRMTSGRLPSQAACHAAFLWVTLLWFESHHAVQNHRRGSRPSMWSCVKKKFKICLTAPIPKGRNDFSICTSAQGISSTPPHLAPFCAVSPPPTS